MKQTDILIVGGGASGMCAAIRAKQTANRLGVPLSVTVLEKETLPCKKILATGNGKCNLANRDVSLRHYQGDRQTLQAVFSRFSGKDIERFFAETGVPFADDGSGRLYPLSRKASAVSDALITEARRVGVETVCGVSAERIQREQNGFCLNGEYACRILILAAGGAAGLKKTAVYNGFDLARQLELPLVKPYACLCGLVLDRSYPASLKGVRQIARIRLLSAKGKKELFAQRGEVQFNADGVSGIPVLQASLTASRLLRDGEELRLELDFLPDIPLDSLIRQVGGRIKNTQGMEWTRLFTGYLPKPLWEYAMKRTGIRGTEPVRYSDSLAGSLARNMKFCDFAVTGTADWESAQICGGGVDGRVIGGDWQVKSVPGLYLCGEMLDVQGECGGYNLMWAWASGCLAGEKAAERLIGDK